MGLLAATVNIDINVMGLTLTQRRSNPGDGGVPLKVELPAAKNGTLTTRTDDNTGELTMAASHGITTGQLLDVYWTKSDGTVGCRRGMTVGTVATNAVPIDGGSGDNLPTQATVITAQVPVSYDFATVGNKLLVLGANAQRRASVAFLDGDDAQLAAYTLNPGAVEGWWKFKDGANPLAGATSATVLLSNGDSAASNQIQVVAVTTEA